MQLTDEEQKIIHRHRNRMLPDAILQPGERLRIGMMMADSAILRGTEAKDSTMTTTIQDSIGAIPETYRHKMASAMSFVNGSSRGEIENGIRQMDDIRRSLAMTGDGAYAGTSGFLGDADTAACKRVADYIDGQMSAAHDRLSRL